MNDYPPFRNRGGGFFPVYHDGGPSALTWTIFALQVLTLLLLLALGDRAPLVAQLLAPRDRDLDLHSAVLEIEPRRHEGEALLAHLGVQPLDLAPVQQELARPVGLVVLAVALPVLGHVQADEPRLA